MASNHTERRRLGFYRHELKRVPSADRRPVAGSIASTQAEQSFHRASQRMDPAKPVVIHSLPHIQSHISPTHAPDKDPKALEFHSPSASSAVTQTPRESPHSHTYNKTPRSTDTNYESTDDSGVYLDRVEQSEPLLCSASNNNLTSSRVQGAKLSSSTSASDVNHETDRMPRPSRKQLARLAAYDSGAAPDVQCGTSEGTMCESSSVEIITSVSDCGASRPFSPYAKEPHLLEGSAEGAVGNWNSSSCDIDDIHASYRLSDRQSINNLPRYVPKGTPRASPKRAPISNTSYLC